MTAPMQNPIPMRERLRTDYEWTERQREVLNLLARGKSNQDIADALGISLDGAKWHMREILSKLGVDTREEAAEYWRRHNGWKARWRRAVAAPSTAGIGIAAGASVGVLALIGLAFAVFRGGSETESNRLRALQPHWTWDSQASDLVAHVAANEKLVAVAYGPASGAVPLRLRRDSWLPSTPRAARSSGASARNHSPSGQCFRDRG